MFSSNTKMTVPFNRPTVTGAELDYIREAIQDGHLCSGGNFTERCHRLLFEWFENSTAFLTSSGSTALEMSALVSRVGPGDEVILPSFTFLTTASSFALRGAIPIFVDIRADNFNLNEDLVAEAAGQKTKAIIPVHYAGITCNLDELAKTAKACGAMLIEDAAHALHSRYKGRPAGSFGAMSIFSFHAAKNINSGEGGVLIVNDKSLVDRSWEIWDKGTNKRRFLEGQIEHYSWTDLSSSFAPSEITAAYLLAQLENSQSITEQRVRSWDKYFAAFEELELQGLAKRPLVSDSCQHNGHIFYLVLENKKTRDALIAHLKKKGISALFHYIPLHLSPAGKKFGRTHGSMANTEQLSARIIRLPIWNGLPTDAQEFVCSSVFEFFGVRRSL